MDSGLSLYDLDVFRYASRYMVRSIVGFDGSGFRPAPVMGRSHQKVVGPCTQVVLARSAITHGSTGQKIHTCPFTGQKIQTRASEADRLHQTHQDVVRSSQIRVDFVGAVVGRHLHGDDVACCCGRDLAVAISNFSI
ncbi:hypothetical protein Ddye_008309 [Dipteronia dyeriana]|uniref:Uncharacterized protein n=1 Tax=Dipteronia dyeriana TaxID=168575 RepID=A0AAE0CL71_9ROSI|nr:hypothetical protein Ddye_008309 [Dipteronia dyeriana]